MAEQLPGPLGGRVGRDRARSTGSRSENGTWDRLPYTEDDEANTRSRMPRRRIHSMTDTVPARFTLA